MPDTQAHEAEQPAGSTDQRRERNDPPQAPRRRWATLFNTVALVVALVLALYNNALIEQLPSQQTSPTPWVVETETFEPLAPCNEGGIRLVTGLDKNFNGVLDAGESTSSTVLCHGLQGLSGPQGQPGQNGASPAVSLLNSTAVPMGNASCPSGGTAISSGLDINADGHLNADEISSNHVVCNGVGGLAGTDGMNGENGYDGTSALVDKVLAPAHLCADGLVVRFGVDDGRNGGTDGNGELEDGEVRESLKFCFEPLRSERLTDIVPGIGDSFTTNCDAAAWVNGVGRLFFAANDGANGCELHVTSAEINTSSLVVDMNPTGDALPGRDLGMTSLADGSGILFDATDGLNGRQLWVSDGTASGTRALGTVEAEAPVEWNGGWLFSAASGERLWTNGTDLRPWHQQPSWTSVQQAGAQANLSNLSNIGAKWFHGDGNGVWFSASDPSGDVEPYRLSNDGTLSAWNVNPNDSTELLNLLSDGEDLLAVGVRGTAKQVLRLHSNGNVSWLTAISPSSGDTHLGEGMGLHRIGDNLVYDAVTYSNEARLWTTNLANGITVQLSAEMLAPGAQVGVANTGTTLVFDCITPTRGTEWCITDATPLGSHVLHDLNPGVFSSNLRGLSAVGEGAVLVSDGTVDGDAWGQTLWVVEGSSLRPVLNPWSGVGNDSQALTYGRLLVGPSSVFFIAHDGVHGHEWWRWSHGELSEDWVVINR